MASAKPSVKLYISKLLTTMMGSLSPPHKQLHQVGRCHWKKYSKAAQLRVRDFERHALKNKDNQSSSDYTVMYVFVPC